MYCVDHTWAFIGNRLEEGRAGSERREGRPKNVLMRWPMRVFGGFWLDWMDWID